MTKIIDHVTKEEIGEMGHHDFSIGDKFRIPQKGKESLYFIVTGVDCRELTLFQITKEQHIKGMELKDLLI